MKCLICIIKVRILFQTNKFSDNTVSDGIDDYKYISEPHDNKGLSLLRNNQGWVDTKSLTDMNF